MISPKSTLYDVLSTRHERSQIKFGSLLERDWIVALVSDPRYVDLITSPFTVTYEHAGQTHQYTPTLMAICRDMYRQWAEVFEVKPASQMLGSWSALKPAFRAARQYCKQREWVFYLISERDIQTPYVQNAKFLHPYRDMESVGAQRLALTSTLENLGGVTTPEILVLATWASMEKRLEAVRELWRLVAIGVINTWLDKPLTMSSEIWLAEIG